MSEWWAFDCYTLDRIDNFERIVYYRQYVCLEKKKMNQLYRKLDTKKYHVFAPMGIFHLELIYLYFPPYKDKLILRELDITNVEHDRLKWIRGINKLHT